MQIELTKHHGLGNDFLVMNVAQADESFDWPTLAQRWCDRRFGVGADGLLLLEIKPNNRLGMVLYNADGSRAEMSGNGIRCLGQALAMARDDHEAMYVIGTDAGLRELVVHDDAEHRLATVSVTMGPVGEGPAIPKSVSERLAGERHATADMGNPHLVVLVADLHQIDLVGTGSWLEQQFPAGVNVEIIEIGSGFSTACMLDAIEREGLETTIICVEPFPQRLRSTLTDRDTDRVTIIEAMVQTTAPEMYDTLEAGDILFIDSSHVAKTGSDVNYLFFEILPRLRKGVIIHVHDIYLPDEYPREWVIDENRSWNEQYVLRALLMYSTTFKVIFGSWYAFRKFPELVSAALNLPDGSAFGGGSIWLRKVE